VKKNFFMFFLGVAVCAAALNAQTLDLAIIGAAAKISRDLPAGAPVAVINFRSDSENLNEYVLNELYGAILRNRSVVPVQPNQRQFQTIHGELNKAGKLNSESAQNIGKLLGAQYLITGSIEQVGALYKIVFNAVSLDAELQSQYQASLNPRNDTQLASLLSGESQPSAASFSQPKPVTIAAITGVTAPVMGRTPVKKITENVQYSGTVTWSPAVSGTFKLNTQYTATITLTAKNGYTLQGVAANFFKVAGAASASNNANTSVVTAKFPPTKDSEDSELRTLGISLGTSWCLPIICIVHGTLAPFKNSFFELGMDASMPNGLFFNYDDLPRFSLYPFANYALFVPFARTKRGKRGGGWYAGAGFGVMFAKYTFVDVGSIWDTSAAMNIFTGFNLGMFDISYTLRTDFDSFNSKLSFGYVYRFK